ncbi:MAG: hypothetical protein D6806_08145 [Deltaproteobacteria bacterium]|nr:MAG: hypothetical protein D6806_08145 [Deltaproteobacteria bacterium]
MNETNGRKALVFLPLAALSAAMLFTGCQQYSNGRRCDPALGAERYECPDGTTVPWCTCEAGGWNCIDEPQKQCGQIPPCESDYDCMPSAYCDPCATSSCPACDDCVPGCLLHGCSTESQQACDMTRPDCGEGAVAVVKDGCWECVNMDSCDPGEHRDTSCDDGNTLSCGDAQPQCAHWEIPAIVDGCWLCVNPDTCRPWSEPGCTTDAQCSPEQRCDDCARGSCPECEDCVADCVPHGCATEPQADCKLPRPECGEGQVAVVEKGCWVCVDLGTCAVPRDTSCDDGSEVLCDMVPPECGEYEILAAQDGCWTCVNPATCKPWGEPGCSGDGDCSAERYCDFCGTSSCPFCDDCVASCISHGCPTEQALNCNCARPDCGNGAVAVIENGCWVCVDMDSCKPTGDGC